MSINVSMFFGFHDSGVAFSSDAKILLCLQAERIFRKKHMRATSNQLEYLVAIGLKELNLSINEIDTLFIGRWGCEPTSFIHLLGRRFAPVWTAHHANHIGWAKSVGWESGFAVCADGGSENGCSGIYKFNSGGYEPIADLDSTILTGKYYGAITQLLFDVDPESAHVHLPGKTMGIAAFGSFDPILAKHILTQVDGGAIHTERISKIADFLQFKSSFDSRDRRRWNFAHTAQAIWETQWLETLAQFCPAGEKLIFSGGCALNVQLNARLRHSGLFADLFIPPTPGDDGQALGALIHQTGAKLTDPYLGRVWGSAERAPEQLISDLSNKKIVFWFDGRSEVGPRALGHRSIFGAAETLGLRRKLSEEVKQREWYRPVAPIVLAEDAAQWFHISQDIPWMTEAVVAKSNTLERSPAVVHVDGTSRIQTVRCEQEPILHDVLTQYQAATGVPLLMNTSMNLPNEPICDSPEDAIHTFRGSGADVLYIHGKRYTQYDLN